MAKIACTDKKRNHRVIASGSLNRQDYFCPNPNCDAVMILVDCDDETRTDHFRVKKGFSHVQNCEYASDKRFIQYGNLTDKEFDVLEKTMALLKDNLKKLNTLFNGYLNNSSISKDRIILQAFKDWLNRDLNNTRDLKRISAVFLKIEEYINNINLKDKFKYKNHKKNTVAQSFPSQRFKIDLCESFFQNANETYIEQQGTIFHECLHQVYKKADFGYGEKCKNYLTIFKRLNADNWSECFEEILYNKGGLI